jgi:hypothetical protein
LTTGFPFDKLILIADPGVVFVQLTIYYTEDDLYLIKQVEAKAERERRSKSSVILSLIEEYFERNKRVGEILVDLGKLTEDRLQQALELQKKEGGIRTLGEILLSKRWVSEHDLERALLLQDKSRQKQKAAQVP